MALIPSVPKSFFILDRKLLDTGIDYSENFRGFKEEDYFLRGFF